MSRHGYPRPQLERKHWTSLNGEWDFALDPENAFTHPNDVKWSGKIEVPFAPETQASGIGNTGFFHAVWYRRTIEQPRLQPGSRTLLHFGAVDYKATVWINGCEAVTHEGGYTPFTVDLSPFSKQELLTIVVRAIDDPSDLSQPRGKQDWQLEPHSIWYPRTTGIWQTVWMETVPSTWIGRIRWTPNLERWELGVEAWLDGARREGLKLGVKLSVHRVSREWIAAIARDTSHPCIVAWVPINESWGVPNLPTNAAEWDMLAGIVAPELGGHPRYLDIMGVNFYHSNQ